MADGGRVRDRRLLGMDALAAFLAAADASPLVSLHSLLVKVRGETKVEAYWTPYVASDRTLVYSASKTVAATAVGLAVGEGLFGLDDRIVDLLPESVPDGVDDRTAELTVHHILSMSTGHDADTLDAVRAAPDGDGARALLSIPPQTPVGSRHVYNNGASWLLGELVRRRTGGSLMAFLRPRLFEPLGIAPAWEVDRLGREWGFSGCRLTTRELSAIGELYLNDGVHDGRRVLPEGWVAAASTMHIDTRFEENPDWALGYGYQVWGGREGYRLDGAYGQFSFVLPEPEATITLTSGGIEGGKAVLELVFEHLVPALAEPWASPGELALPMPTDAGASGPWSAAVVPPRPVLAPGSVQGCVPEVTDARASRDGDRWTLALTWDGVPLSLAGGPGWTRQLVGPDNVPVALAMGTEGSDAVAHLVFTDTPHVLVVRLGARTGVAWLTSPLHGPALRDLRTWA